MALSANDETTERAAANHNATWKNQFETPYQMDGTHVYICGNGIVGFWKSRGWFHASSHDALKMTEIEFSASSLSYATFDALPFISMVDLYAINPTAECLEMATESTEQVPDLGIEESGLKGEMNYTPGICTLSTKQNVCRWPTPSVQKLNSWTCRNCFRLRQGSYDQGSPDCQRTSDRPWFERSQ